MSLGVVRLGAIRLGMAAFALALAVLMSTGPGSSAAAAAPPTVRSSSLDLSGQNLVWRAQLSRAFTAAGLARQGATLCLVIDRSSHTEKVCLTQGSGASALAVSSGGRNRTVAATVTRPTARTLLARFKPGAIGVRNRNFVWQTETTAARSASVFPTGGQEMNLRPYRVVGCVAKGPETVDHGPTDQRVVAFTFDDGPWKQTAAILNVLEQKRAVATFFQVGDRVARYAALDRRMLRDGDMIGDHSWDHSNLKGKREECKCQIKKALVAIRAATGFTPCLWRPPYGAVDKDEEDDAREVGFTTVGWSDTPQDWHQPGVQQIIHLTVSQADPGAIILHHDGTEPRNTEWWNNNRRETLAALPHEIDMLRSEGYRFVTVTQLLGYRLKYKK